MGLADRDARRSSRNMDRALATGFFFRLQHDTGVDATLRAEVP
jgi:hypothetical protein